MMYRFHEAMANEAGLAVPRGTKRPGSKSVTSIKEAEHWRQQVFREITKKVSRIQSTGLNDYQLREMNDEINELLREKNRWEYRIKELGGRNYMQASRVVDNEGREIFGSKGYRYFGRARELPGVKELLVAQGLKEEWKEEHAPYVLEEKHLNAVYYGLIDSLDDNILLNDEEKLENSLSQSKDDDLLLNLNDIIPEIVPTQKQVEQHLLDSKRAELMKRYGLD